MMDYDSLHKHETEGKSDESISEEREYTFLNFLFFPPVWDEYCTAENSYVFKKQLRRICHLVDTGEISGFRCADADDGLHFRVAVLCQEDSKGVSIPPATCALLHTPSPAPSLRKQRGTTQAGSGGH